MFKLRRKPKTGVGFTTKELHSIVREELALSATEQRRMTEEEKKKLLIRERINTLPKRTRLKFMRYLEAKKGEHGKK